MATPIDVTTEEELKEHIADSHETPVLVYFYSATCPHCKKQSPVIEEWTEEADGVKTVRIQAQDCLPAFKTHRVLGTPTMIIFNGGEEIARQSGFKEKDVLESWIEDHT